VNSEALLSFLITLAEFFLGFFVWLKNPKNESHRLFFAFVACLVLWGLSDAGLRLSENRAAAEMVHKLGAIGFCLFPAVFLHFVSVYTGYGRLMNRSLSYVFLYGGALALTMFHTMGFITEVTITTNGIFSVSHAKGYDAYVVWISLCCLISAVLMVRRYPSSSLPEQKTLLLLAFGAQTGTLPLLFALSLFGQVLPLIYSMLSKEFPLELSGRVISTLNFLVFLSAFAVQWGTGLIINLWPVEAGRYADAGYATAFGACFALLLAPYVLLLLSRRAGASRE